MIIDHQTPLDLNVTITVLDEHGNQVRRSKYKNTATKRMTTGIALFLAGDAATYENMAQLGSPPSGLGRWRPNFISFATTGIDEQPTTADGLATVNDPEAFANKNPLPGERTRPWFQSQYLGEHSDGFWNPEYGWGTPEHPNTACFQGELVEATTSLGNPSPLRRHQILRAEVTSDNSWEREIGQEGYSTDCILYGYSSVLWNKQFFKPANGPEVPRIAISELGLYEMDSDSSVGCRTLMAGFRVPSVDDIIYVNPGYVVLVEWRITIRALMPYEGVAGLLAPMPTGISTRAWIIDEKHAQMDALVHGPSLVPQNVTWSLTGQADPETTITQDGLLTLATHESAEALYVRCEAQANPEVYSSSVIITGMIRNLVTGLSISTLSTALTEIQLMATVLGKGTFSQDVTWALTGNTSPDTTITQDGLITLAEDEEAYNLTVTATSNDDSQIKSVAAVVRIDKASGVYVVSDFTILTE